MGPGGGWRGELCCTWAKGTTGGEFDIKARKKDKQRNSKRRGCARGDVYGMQSFESEEIEKGKRPGKQ